MADSMLPFLILIVLFLPAVFQEVNLPEEAARPIAECKTLLQVAVDAGDFFIEVITAGDDDLKQWPQVPTNGGGGSVQSKAPTGGLREVDRRHEVVHVLWRTNTK